MEQEEYLTVAEIATRFKLNPQTVRNWIDAGELRAVRVGARRVRVRQSDLEAFISREREQVKTRAPSQGDRITRLEARVDELAAVLQDLSARLPDPARNDPRAS